MKILVLGAGGVGGYFGGRLAEGGADVTFLVRPARRGQLERDGLRIESPFGNLTLPVKSVISSELRAGYDVVLLTCKAYDLDSAIDAIAPAMNGTCCVLPLLNGISHLDRLAECFGAGAVLGGSCTLAVTLASDGTIRHTSPRHRMVFGERGGGTSTRAQAFADALAKSNVDWSLSTNIEQEMWEKLVQLSALAAVTCLFRANVGEIARATGGVSAAERALADNIAIATAEGHAPRTNAIEQARTLLMDRGSDLTASMLRDLESGARVESDHVLGWMLERARHHGIDAALLSLAYTHLKAYEARRAAGRLPS
jgi:2-dehydropantoate 2-reductase